MRPDEGATVKQLHAVCARWRAAAQSGTEALAQPGRERSQSCYLADWPGMRFVESLGASDSAAAELALTELLRFAARLNSASEFTLERI